MEAMLLAVAVYRIIRISHLKYSWSCFTRKNCENFYTVNLTTAAVVHFPVKELRF